MASGTTVASGVGGATSFSSSSYWIDNLARASHARGLTVANTSVGSDVAIVHLNLGTIEVGADLSAGSASRTELIGPSNRPTIVHATASVVAGPALRMRSSAYLLALRKKKCAKIAVGVEALSEFADRQDFSSYTFPLVDDLARLAADLSAVESHEGNTIAVLRNVRYMFMDGGWDAFRGAGARSVVVSILRELSKTDNVEPSMVKQAFTRLYKAKLAPMLSVEIVPDED